MSSRSQPGIGAARAAPPRTARRNVRARAARSPLPRGALAGLAEHREERPAPGLQPGFELVRAVAVRAGPGLLAREIAAPAPMMGVLHLDQLQVLLPVGAFLVERLVAEADLDPADAAVAGQPRLGH